MKAVMCRKFGPPSTLVIEDLPTPQPGSGQVLIAIHASAVNFADQLLIEGKTHQELAPPFTPGIEAAGIVKGVGADVTDVRVGQRVIGSSALGGGYAEEGVFDAEEVVTIPDSMSFQVAAGFFVASMTSHYALVERAKLKHGESLLVLGAAGGVGLTAVQIGKAIGARVFAACSSDEKLSMAKEHGADVAFKYPTGPFDREGQKRLRSDLKQLLGGARGFDVIYDAVGGSYAEPALRTIARRGCYLVIGFTAGVPSLPMDVALMNNCDIMGITLNRAAGEIESYIRSRPAQQALMRLYEQGVLTAHIGAVFPLERFAEAMDELGSRRATGKVVLAVR